jgi:pimeloyl-ACP methyl ester carboxylesterase
MPAAPSGDGAGVRLHVAEAGSGDPVVLLHGFPQHWYAWRHVIPLLAGQPADLPGLVRLRLVGGVAAGL